MKNLFIFGTKKIREFSSHKFRRLTRTKAQSASGLSVFKKFVKIRGNSWQKIVGFVFHGKTSMRYEFHELTRIESSHHMFRVTPSAQASHTLGFLFQNSE
jgi:hypothetical protein